MIRFLEMALAVAHSSKARKGKRHGAILINGNRIIVSRTNENKTHPALAQYTKYPMTHAETACLLAKRWVDITGSTLYVARLAERGINRFAYSRPCVICQNVAKSRGVKKIIYSINDIEYGVIRF